MPVPARRIPAKKNPWYSLAVATADLTATAEAANARTVSVQLRDRGGNPVTSPTPVSVYLSDAATGAGIAAAAPSGGVAIGANGAILAAVVAGKYLKCITDAAGLLKLVVTEATAKTFYVVVELPDATLAVLPLAFV